MTATPFGRVPFCLSKAAIKNTVIRHHMVAGPLANTGGALNAMAFARSPRARDDGNA